MKVTHPAKKIAIAIDMIWVFFRIYYIAVVKKETQSISST